MSDMALLFQRDPAELTDQDLDKIIAKQREARHLFNQGIAQAGNPKPKKSTEINKLQLALDTPLKDLDL